MDFFRQLGEIGWSTVVIVLLLLIFALPEIIKRLSDLVSFFGIETKWSLKDKAESNIIEELQNEVKQFKENRVHDREQSFQIQKELVESNKILNDKVDDLRRLFIDKEIDDQRYQLLDFANAVMSNREYNKEQYDHMIEIYDHYNRTLSENGLENGRVDASMKFVLTKYEELMESGFNR